MSQSPDNSKPEQPLKGEIRLDTPAKRPKRSRKSKSATAKPKPAKYPLVQSKPLIPTVRSPGSGRQPGSQDPRRWIGLFILSLALTMVILDNTVLNIAIPTIVDEFGARLADLQWVISGYALVVASLLITFGRAGDIFGRRRLFMIGAALFGFGSYLATISYSTLDLLISVSLIEATGAAMMLPATLSLISSTFRGRERAIAFAVWGGIAGAAGAFGPLVGGWLTTNYDWRWAFMINVIVAPIAIAGAWYFIRESKESSAGKRFDLAGVVTSSLGLFALVFALIEGQRWGWWSIKEQLSIGGWVWNWPISIIPVFAVIGLIMLGLFVWIERRKEQAGQQPLLELSLFRFPSFRYGLLTTTILSLGEFGLIFVLPIFFQTARQYSAVDTGVALLPLGIAVIVGAGLAAGLTRYISPKWLITAGMVLEALGIFALGFVLSPSATTLTVAPGLIIYGLGIGLATTQLVNVILSEIPVDKSGIASGVNGTIRQVGTALGIAVIGTILSTQIVTNVASSTSQSEVIPPALQEQMTTEFDWQQAALSTPDLPIDPKVAEELQRVISSAVSDAAITATEFAGIMVLIGAGLSLLIPDAYQRYSAPPTS